MGFGGFHGSVMFARMECGLYFPLFLVLGGFLGGVCDFMNVWFGLTGLVVQFGGLCSKLIACGGWLWVRFCLCMLFVMLVLWGFVSLVLMFTGGHLPFGVVLIADVFRQGCLEFGCV